VKIILFQDSAAVLDLPDKLQTVAEQGSLVLLAPDLIHTVTPEHRHHQRSPENTGGALIGAGSYDVLSLFKSGACLLFPPRILSIHPVQFSICLGSKLSILKFD